MGPPNIKNMSSYSFIEKHIQFVIWESIGFRLFDEMEITTKLKLE